MTKSSEIQIVRTYVDHVKNICYLELANPLTKHIWLVIGRSRMCLILQGTKVKVKVLKPCKSVQKLSEEVLCFKTQYIAQ